MKYSVIGLPHYVIWHIYEPSNDDLKHMEWMAQEEVRLQKEEVIYSVYRKIFDDGFENVEEDWKSEKPRILRNTDSSKLGRIVNVDWSDADIMDQRTINKKILKDKLSELEEKTDNKKKEPLLE
ncbi:unnamed protein product [Ambrosiozyma monospora]|uniref:Unnamed protein product n=1 Tax=Ambrosiozyma monospora TaxID=43982 RepID=A0A9W6YRZ6_AMBMO|nr:unnamed protein product [Ambrosiozyma monospora]